MMVDTRRDPVLDLPLSGTRLIEASAGTGKTHTLVLLLVRAILLEGIEPGELVAVTYTRAAAGELRERLRMALSAAARRAADPHAAVPSHMAEPIDIMIARTLARDAASTRTILARRLRAAEMAIDAVWLGTLHAFCQRLLADAGPSFGMPGIEGDVDDGDLLFESACANAWRALQYRNDDALLLPVTRRIATPGSLATLLKPIMSLPPEALMPFPPPDAQTLSALRSDYQAAWAAARAAAADPVPLIEMIQNRKAYGISYDRAKGLSDERLAEVPQRLADFFGEPAGSLCLDDTLSRLSGVGLAKLQAKKQAEQNVSLPPHPLPPALDALHDAEIAWTDAAHVAMMHRLHADVGARMARMGFEQGRARYDDLISRVARALNGPTGSRLKRFAQSRWRLALIDEFQDTDAEQHAIFADLFGDRLVMVGDPKQAIYRFRGGDVHAYRRAAEQADSIDVLDACYRAEPAVVAAVNVLFDPKRVPRPFLEPFIDYRPVRSAYDEARHGRLLRDGEPAAGLHLWPVLPDDGLSTWSNKNDATLRTTLQVGQAIVAMLHPSTAFHLATQTVHGAVVRPLRASDIAVLCQTHAECAAVARELDQRGVPASLGIDPDVEAAAGEDMRRLLAAWLSPNDSARLRALALSAFYGHTLDRLPEDSERSPLTARQLAEFAEQARLATQSETGLALMRAVRAGTAAARRIEPEGARVDAWLRWVDRLTLWSVDEGRELPGLYLRLRRSLAGQRDADASMRVPDTGDTVAVMTIHASKGLEFGVVFAPFLWNRRDPTRAQRGRIPAIVRFHDGKGRLRADLGSDSYDAHALQADEEDRAEAIRKVYVAVTRARHLACVPVAVTKSAWANAPLSHLLPEIVSGDGADPSARLRGLQRYSNGSIRIVSAPDGVDAMPGAADDATSPLVRRLSRAVPDDFRLLSYSRLSRGLADVPRDYEQDATTSIIPISVAPEVFASYPRGAAFGTCFHALMETLDPSAPDDEILVRLATSHGFGAPSERAYLERLVASTWCAMLPGDVRLGELDNSERSAEMEFFIPLTGFSAIALGQALAEHDAYRRPPERWPATLAAARGYLRGFIDLVYRAQGRYFVLDYKTNDLGRDHGSYGREQVSAAIRGHDYDLQYLIYLVALQRLLRARLGDAYDYDRHIGGAVYVFVRGLEVGEGIHHDRPPRALIDRLERVFAGAAA